MNQEEFSLYKLTGFVVCLVFVAILQSLLPYLKMTDKIKQNWRINLPLSAVNTILLGLVCTGCACGLSIEMQAAGSGLFNFLQWPGWLSLFCSILVLDAIGYCWHRVNHVVPFLWRFHSVHHTDRVYEASTAVRFHAGELLISLAVRLLAIAVFGFSVPALLAFELLFQFFNILIHGNIRLPEKFENQLSRVFLTPALHRKHHSLNATELHSNFGTIFSFWDRIGRSYRKSNSTEVISVGLNTDVRDLSLSEVFLRPFKN